MSSLYPWATNCVWSGASWITCPADIGFLTFGIGMSILSLFELITSNLSCFAIEQTRKLTKDMVNSDTYWTYPFMYQVDGYIEIFWSSFHFLFNIVMIWISI